MLCCPSAAWVLFAARLSLKSSSGLSVTLPFFPKLLLIYSVLPLVPAVSSSTAQGSFSLPSLSTRISPSMDITSFSLQNTPAHPSPTSRGLYFHILEAPSACWVCGLSLAPDSPHSQIIFKLLRLYDSCLPSVRQVSQGQKSISKACLYLVTVQKV